MQFLEPPGSSNSFNQNRSSSQTNFIIEEDSRSDISDFPSAVGNDSNSSGRGFTIFFLSHPTWLKVGVGILCFMVLVLAGISISIGYLYFQTIPSFETCKSRQCTRTATLFVRTMDETIDPCDDFHKFACGNWISDTAAVVSVAVYDHTTIMRDRIVGRLRSLTENITNGDIEALQQVKIMYNTCVDLATIEEQGLQPLIDLILRLVDPNVSIAKTLAKIHRETGQDYIFDMSIGPNFKNTSLHLMSIDQPELPVVKANFLYSPKTIEAYEKLIYKILLKVGKEVGFSSAVLPDIKVATKRISAFEQLFALSMSDDGDRGKAAMANMLSLKELNRLFSNHNAFDPVNDSTTTNASVVPKRNNSLVNGIEDPSPQLGNQQHFFNWTEYVVTLFEGLSDVEITEDFLLNINDLPYIHKIAQIFIKTHPQELNMYLMWELLYTFGKDVTKEFRDYFSAFSAISEGTESTPNRHTECILLLDQSLPFALTHKYILKYVKDSTIDEAKEMFRNIVKAFKHQVENLDWMDWETKQKAILKANKVEGYIGFPKWLKDAKAVNEYHKGLQFTNNSFFSNILIMMRWISQKELSQFADFVDRSWPSTDSPAEADAFYDDEHNAVTFPAGFLQEPFIGMGLKAIDYGALGSVVGHELTHGFDTMGRYSDESGRLNSWWSLDTLGYFLSKAECFEKQYTNYWLPELGAVPGPNNTVDGKRTLAENIADNGGIREALEAYKYYIKKRGSPEPRLPGLEKYTPEHLFFLSFAQSWCSYLSPAALIDMVETNVHSPPKFRIWGPLSNYDEFSRVWQCDKQSNSKMITAEKCVLWG